VAFFGGTFDPIHVGHLIAAQEVASALELDRVVFVPAGDPPHKPGVPMAPAAHRLAMVEAAVAGNPAFAVRRYDLDRAGPHYTIDMLRLGVADLRPAQAYFLIGADSLIDLPTWQDPAGIIALARPIVVARPGFAPDLDALERIIPGLTQRLVEVPIPQIGIASSDIERRVAAGRPIRYQVPDAVEAYIRRHALYR
jgi:nicotinate-nucleotide adenylyltransferase